MHSNFISFSNLTCFIFSSNCVVSLANANSELDSGPLLLLRKKCVEATFIICTMHYVQCNVHLCDRVNERNINIFFFFHFRLTSMHSFHVIRSHTHTSTSLFLICSICSAFGWRGKTKAYTQHTNKIKRNRRYMMSQCQSLQYALGICAICFLLNGISSTEDIVRVRNGIWGSYRTRR